MRGLFFDAPDYINYAEHFWYAVQYVDYAYNLIEYHMHCEEGEELPCDINMPDLSILKRFGCRCVCWLALEKQTRGEKWQQDNKTVEGIFVGIKKSNHTYVVLLDGSTVIKPKYYRGRNITFFEDFDDGLLRDSIDPKIEE